MTHDTHANGSHRPSGRRSTRPQLGRPSLFADFDQPSIADVEPQRIRLLSTLESQRGVSQRARPRRTARGGNHPWLNRVLVAAMALGMLVMLLSFIQLLRKPPAGLPASAMAGTTAVAGTHAEPVPPSTIEPLGAAAEIVDVAPPAAGPHASQDASPDASTAADEALAMSPTLARTPSVVPPERALRTEKPAPPRPNAKRDASASPDDVALVEAMLAHAGPRKAPPATASALRQCGTDSSPETALCRARICGQHATLPGCQAP